MGESELQRHVRQALGLRVGPETARYLAARASGAPEATVPVIAGEARTGRPLRAEVPAGVVRDVAAGRGAGDGPADGGPADAAAGASGGSGGGA